VIYLDSSALLKFVIQEAESEVLRAWLDGRSEPAVSSELAKVEVILAARRVLPGALPVARAVIAAIDLLPLSGAVVDLAAGTEQQLRSCDALHLASAVLLGDELTDFVTYDHRLATAARTARLHVSSPGATSSMLQ
jgi:predicted nucleic acid-binding protein